MTNKINPVNPTRFLPDLSQPDPNHHDQLELDEGDVVWSDDRSETSDTPSISPPAPSPHRHLRRGLSSVLDSSSTVVRRKSTLSAVSAARLIPPLAALSAVPSSKFPMSAPVNVPVWGKRADDAAKRFNKFDDVADEDDGGDVDGEMVPPHVIVARSHVTTFSVFEGVGRTLKGRDLRSVRNAVFQKTGFID